MPDLLWKYDRGARGMWHEKNGRALRHGQSDREEMSVSSTAFEPTGKFTLAHKG